MSRHTITAADLEKARADAKADVLARAGTCRTGALIDRHSDARKAMAGRPLLLTSLRVTDSEIGFAREIGRREGRAEADGYIAATVGRPIVAGPAKPSESSAAPPRITAPPAPSRPPAASHQPKESKVMANESIQPKGQTADAILGLVRAAGLPGFKSDGASADAPANAEEREHAPTADAKADEILALVRAAGLPGYRGVDKKKKAG